VNAYLVFVPDCNKIALDLFFAFSLYAAGHQTFEASKVCKNACQSSKGLSTPALTHQKNSGHSVLFGCANRKVLLNPNTKPLR